MTLIDTSLTHPVGDVDLASAFSKMSANERFKMYDNLLMVAALWGAERGYNEAADIIRQSLDGADLNDMWREFQATLTIWNRDRSVLVNALSYTVTKLVEQIRYPIQEDFEQATEYGEPKGIRLGPAFNLGYSFDFYDVAIRYTWRFLAESTRDQIEALNNEAIEADNRLMFTRILRQLFNSANDTATINEQPVTVYALYNADGTVPPKFARITHTGTHTHYITSGAATVDPQDLIDVYEHLRHHGYGLERGYKHILLVSRTEGLIIRTFKVATGAQYDFIPNENTGGGIIMPNGTIVGRPTGSIPGLTTVGTYGPWVIVENDLLVPGYMVGLASSGEKGIGNPVGIREHENRGLRGLQLVKGRDNDYPLTDSFYRRGFGTGVRHRGGAVVMQITAAATYTVPAEYV